MKPFAYKKDDGFAAIVIVIILGVLLGAASFFAVWNATARGSSEVNATVRVADGTTEDEIFIHSSSVTKTVASRAVFLNSTAYTLKTAKISDADSVSFNDCKLAGIYEPVKCTATNGTPYWITLTKIE